MSRYIHKSHSVSVLMYHIVCPAKYRRAVFDKKADEGLRDACLGISKRYDVDFIEVGVDKDHVHFFGKISLRIGSFERKPFLID